MFLHTNIADRRMGDREFVRWAGGHQAVRYYRHAFDASPPASVPFSATDDLAELLRHCHLDVSSAFLVGASAGGALAINRALEHPDMVRGILLAAPRLSGGILPPYTTEEKAAFEYDDLRCQQIARAWSGGDRAGAEEELQALWCSALEGPALELWRRMVRETTVEVFEERSDRFARASWPAEPRLPRLRAPTTVLLGGRDNPSPAPFVDRVARSTPGARRMFVTGADHRINLSRPGPLDAALGEALRGTSPRREWDDTTPSPERPEVVRARAPDRSNGLGRAQGGPSKGTS